MARLDPVEVLWVSPQPAPKGLLALAPRRLREHLGRAADAVVLDLHEGLDADVLGQAQGFVRGGGRLLLRLPADDSVPLVGQGTLALHPHVPEEVGDHLWRRLLSRLQEGPALGLAEVMEPVSHELSGTLEQDALVDELVAAWTGEARSCRVVLADRGRGKSAGLGRAIARSLAAAPLRVLVTSGQRGQAEELMGFATGGPLSSGGPGSPGARSPGASPLGAGSLRYLPLAELLAAEGPAEAYGSPGAVDLLVVDEAAHLPIPALQALVERHPMAHLAFATTSRGYEGTGRGFVLRFLAWLGEVGRPPGCTASRPPSAGISRTPWRLWSSRCSPWTPSPPPSAPAPSRRPRPPR